MSRKVFYTRKIPSLAFEIHDAVALESLDKQIDIVRKILIDYIDSDLKALITHIKQDMHLQ